MSGVHHLKRSPTIAVVKFKQFTGQERFRSMYQHSYTQTLDYVAKKSYIFSILVMFLHLDLQLCKSVQFERGTIKVNFLTKLGCLMVVLTSIFFPCVLCLLACSMPNKYFCSSIHFFCLSVLLFPTSLVCLHLIKLLTSW